MYIYLYIEVRLYAECYFMLAVYFHPAIYMPLLIICQHVPIPFLTMYECTSTR